MGSTRGTSGCEYEADTTLEDAEAETERRGTMVKILSEGVYAYLKRKGLLAAQGDQTGGKIPPDPTVIAGNRPMTGNRSDGKIPDE